MKNILFILILLLINSSFAKEITVIDQKPDDFVNLVDIIPQIQVDMRYYFSHNFVGHRIDGYDAPICLLTKSAARALKAPEQQLLKMGLTFKVYDCYRPVSAVHNFATWADNEDDTKMQAEFYPQQDKYYLFQDGYISKYSTHSRGSTLDLTIVPLNSTIPQYNKNQKLVACTAPQSARFPDNSLDFGTGFDCFSNLSHPENKTLSPQIRANRLLLRTLMISAGFKPLSTEWWHFSLIQETYPNSYFNFPVK